MTTSDYLQIEGLPGRWQFWGEAEEPNCWFAPADEEAHAAVREKLVGSKVAIRAGFALAPRGAFYPVPVKGDLLLF